MFNRKLFSVVFVLALFIAFNIPLTGAASTVTNPGFETGPSQTPAGWSTSSPNGSANADFQEAGGHAGSFRLSHWRSTAYIVSTFQTLTGLTNGTYTLRVWIKSSGSQNAAYISLSNCGSAEQRANLPAASNWTQISVSTNVTNNQCTVTLFSDAKAGNWANFDDVEFFAAGATPTSTPTPAAGQLSILGADVSSLKKSEDKGGVYRYENGTQGDALQILKDHGLNYIRLRVWVNPADGYNNKARVLQMATRVKAKGMKLLIDLHYSDRWADPGQQAKPAAWANLNFTQLKQAVYDHTFDICNSLKAQGTTPDMIQIGNEINDGMLWPDGRASTNWNNLADLLKQAYNAVKACSPSTLVMIHLAEGGNNSTARWWFDNAQSRGVQWDVTGFSYYSYWHGTLSALQTNLNDIAARYGKPIVVAETAYPFTLSSDDSFGNIIDLQSELTAGYAASTAGQASNLRAVMNVVRAVPNGRGWGVFYWDATWTAVTGNGWDPADPNSGNGWDNQALFAFNDRAQPAMSEFKP